MLSLINTKHEATLCYLVEKRNTPRICYTSDV